MIKVVLEVETYSIDELDDEVRAKVIKEYREGMDLQPECDYLSESFDERLAETGFEEPEVLFSLNGCQGDGVSFTATGIDISKLFGAYPHLAGYKLAKSCIEDGLVYFRIIRNRHMLHYVHHKTVRADYSDYSGAGLEDEAVAECNQLMEDLDQIKDEICMRFEREGYEELEYQQSDERILEDIRAMGTRYTKHGTTCISINRG